MVNTGTSVYTVNTGLSDTCEVGEPISVEDECKAAAQALSTPYARTVSLDYVPYGCMIYDSPGEQYVYLNTHQGSITGVAHHHKVRHPRRPWTPHMLTPKNLCAARPHRPHFI